MTNPYDKLVGFSVSLPDYKNLELWQKTLKEKRKVCKHDWKDAGTSYDGGDDRFECSKCGKIEWLEYD